MRTVITWTDRIESETGANNEKTKTPVNGLAFRPDGTQIIAAVGPRVYVYGSAVGEPIHTLKGHKDVVYCVAYSKDGKRFASGGADKTVIIWTTKAEGILKYQHTDSIQCLAYNPVTQQLASGTATDFGLWHPEQKSVSKHKVPSKVLCCAWTNDGNFLSLGLLNGNVTIREKAGDEKYSIKRGGPIWTLAWNPAKDEPFDILAVGCWDQTLSFYHVAGKAVGRDRRLEFDPCTVSYFSNGDYMIVGGSDKKASLWTKEGVRLTTICECEDWVWCAAQRPKQNFVAVGTNDGNIIMYQLIFSTVHGLYQDQYAYREVMTDVIVQQLVTEKKLRIRCKDYVKKIAIYRDRLAVQLPDRIMIYELYYDDNYELKNKLKDRIMKKLDCNLLVVTCNNIVLCQEKKLQLFDLQGNRQREWILDAIIRYIKVVGGPPDKEELLVGLKNGAVLKIFIDNPFPILIIKLNAPVRQVDMSSSKMKLAVVDESANCLVYHLKNKELIFQESNANSIAWNTEYEDMLCFSGSNVLNIKTGTFPVHQQKMQGFVVGFKGSKIFCLHFVAMQSIDVPQSASMFKYLEKKDYVNAYKIACLGVTENDWRALALQALSGLNLEIARKAFIRIRDVRYLELLNKIENDKRLSTGSGGEDYLYLAEIYAYQGKYDEASKYFQKAGQSQRAVEMFTDLKMWTEAKPICSSDESLKEVLAKQALWAEETGDASEAAALWVKAGEHMKAITIMGEKRWMDSLVEVCRQLNKTEVNAIRVCGQYFRQHGIHQYAKEAYLKIGDIRMLMQLHVDLHKWDEAFQVLETHPEFTEDVYHPFAEWLALNDRFDEAQQAYTRANQPLRALRMIEQLGMNSVTERRFKDASFYFFNLSHEYVKRKSEDGADLEAAHRFRRLAELYYMYSFVHKYSEQPFTSHDSTTLLHCCRSLLMQLRKLDTPPGINKLTVLHSLSKLSKALQCYKLARNIYDRMAQYVLPKSMLDQVELQAVLIRAKDYTDKEDMQPMCYRCSWTNPMINPNGDVCVNCKAPFVRSFITFEHLPLVEFRVTDAPEQEVLALLNDPYGLSVGTKKKTESDGWKNSDMGGANVLTLGEDEINMDDPFQKMLVNLDVSKEHYQPVEITMQMLKTFKREELFVTQYGLHAHFYRNVLPEISIITLCNFCNHFFHEDDFEFESLKKGGCPVCGAKLEGT